MTEFATDVRGTIEFVLPDDVFIHTQLGSNPKTGFISVKTNSKEETRDRLILTVKAIVEAATDL